MNDEVSQGACPMPAPCGPDACFVMTDADAAYYIRASAELRGITRPSGDPDEAARYRDFGAGTAAGWTPRMQAAAAKLEALWRESLRGWTGPGSYRTGGAGDGGTSEADEDAAGVAFKAYREAAEAVQAQCSAAHARALRLAVIEHEPSPLGRAYLVREALRFLADWWKLK